MRTTLPNYIKVAMVLLSVTPSLCNITCAAQKNHNQNLDKGLKLIYSKSNLPGFAVGIIQDDSTLFCQGYGFADIQQKKAYTPETIQPIGSVSKTFIGLALVKALELGYFDLATDINQILPFKIINPHRPQDTIRVIDLATHTSGLVDNDSIYAMTYCMGDSSNTQLAEFLKDYYTTKGGKYDSKNFISGKPGEYYSYSNIASALTAYIIEVKAGMSFDDFTEKYLFLPMKMNHTTWQYRAEFNLAYATLYEINKQSLPLYKAITNKDNSLKRYSCITYPDGSLKSSVNDLIKYLKEINAGFKRVGIVTTAPFYEQLFTKRFKEENMPLNMPIAEPNRALFWAYNRKDKLSHNGSDPGVTTFISYDPTTHIGKILLINTQIEGEDNIKTVECCKRLIMEIEKYEFSIQQRLK